MKLYIQLILCLMLSPFSVIGVEQEVVGTEQSIVDNKMDNNTSLEDENIFSWIEQSLTNLSPEEVQFVANTLFFFHKQALFQSALQERLIALSGNIARIYGAKGASPLHPQAKDLNETAASIENITYQYDYILRIMDHMMHFWNNSKTEYEKAYKALEDVGGIDLYLHENMAKKSVPFVKEDLQVITPEMIKLEKMLALYTQVYTDIQSGNVLVEGHEINEPVQLEDKDILRTVLIMSENLILEMTHVFENVLYLYGYNALLGKASAVRHAQWYTAVYDYMVEQEFEKQYFTILFDENGLITEEKRVYALSKLD